MESPKGFNTTRNHRSNNPKSKSHAHLHIVIREQENPVKRSGGVAGTKTVAPLKRHMRKENGQVSRKLNDTRMAKRVPATKF